jgi:hypothetical protein
MQQSKQAEQQRVESRPREAHARAAFFLGKRSGGCQCWGGVVWKKHMTSLCVQPYRPIERMARWFESSKPSNTT